MLRTALCLATAALVLAAAPSARDAREARSLHLGGTLLQLSSAHGSLWVVTCDERCSGEARRSSGRIVRIDPERMRVSASAALRRPGPIAVAQDGVFATDFWRDSVRRFDPTTLRQTATLKLGAGFFPSDLAVGSGAVWVSTEWCALARADRRLRRVVASVRLPCDAYQTMAVGRGAVWLSESLAGLYRVDAATNRVVARIHIGRSAGLLVPIRLWVTRRGVVAVGVWTLNGELTNRNGLARLGSTRLRVPPLPSGRLTAALGDGSLWVARVGGSVVERIDPSTGRVLRRFRGRVGVAFAVAAGRLWTATGDGTIRPLVVVRP